MRVLENNIIAEVEYINKVLKGKKKGFNRLAEEEYNKTGQELEQDIIDLGYIKIKNGKVNQFVLQQDGQEVRQQGGQLVGQEVAQPIIEEVAITTVTESMALTTEEEGNIKDLMSNFDIIMEIVEQYKKANTIPTGNIVIQLPHEENKSFKASLRINEPVFKEFQEFCNKNKQFTQKELLSMAMLEYIKNHS